VPSNHPCQRKGNPVRRDFSVQNIQPVGIFKYKKICSQSGFSSTKYSISRDFPVQTMQSVGIFQYKIFNQ
jgi:hypothetical protein